MNKTCIVIAGPTAVGKTDIAISLAKHFSTKIISADSRQCFKELNIGVAKPSAEQLLSVPHYFINSHSIHDNVTAAVFENYALRSINEIFQNSDVAVMVGGTGLYIKAFCEGMDPVPNVPVEIRNEITENFNQHGLKWVIDQMLKLDPGFSLTEETENPQRMMRALEVLKFTGKPLREFFSKEKKTRDFDIIKIAVNLPRELLYERINTRVDKMVNEGLVDEARSLYTVRHLNALQTVGYKELFSSFDGDIDLSRAIDLIKQNSRQYAKRQITWFKRENMTWLDANEDAVSAVNKMI